MGNIKCKKFKYFFGDDLLELGLNLDVKLKGYEKVPDKFRIKNQELLNKLKG